MYRTTHYAVARDIAERKGLLFGPSVAGGWYVGTRVELEKVAVPTCAIIDPTKAKGE